MEQNSSEQSHQDQEQDQSVHERSPAVNNDDYTQDDLKTDEEDIQGKIFIGGLSWQTTETTLRYYFERFGELSDVALMVDKRTGKPRGFGFIKMKDPKAADVVMANDHTIDGRLVDVKRALPRDKAPGPASRSESCKVFVGGLAQEVSEKEFGEYFSRFGAVKDAVVMVDRNTGSSRGFGFITFEREDVVEQVMKLEHEIKGKYVEIKRAEPREAGRGGYSDGGAMGYGAGGMGYGGGRGGGRGMGGRGMGGRGMNDGGMYGQGYGQPGGNGGYNRFPQAGYGAQPGYRPAVGPYGMPNMQTGANFGYAAAPGMGAQGMGYYAAAMPSAGGYAGYGAAAGANPTAMNPGMPGSGYGGAAPFNSNQSGRSAEGNQYVGTGDARSAGVTDGQSKGYDNSALAGYQAAMQMRVQPQAAYGYGGAAPMQNYGVAPSAVGYGYGGAAAAPMRPTNSGEGGDQSGYGTYRGQGAAQGRTDRSYRPY